MATITMKNDKSDVEAPQKISKRFNSFYKDICQVFNEVIIQNKIPFEMVSKMNDDGFYTIITIKSMDLTVKSDIRLNKRDSEVQAKGLVLMHLCRTRNNTKVPKTFAVPEMDQKDHTDAVETLTVDKASKTMLVHQRDESQSHFAELSDNFKGMTAFGDKPNSFNPLTDRWNKLDSASGVIKTSDLAGSIIKVIEVPIDILKDLQTNPAYIPFKQYAYVKPEIQLRLVLNSTKFHQGLFIVGLRYGEKYTRTADGVDNIDNAVQLVQMNHILLNAAVSNVGILDIPFISIFDMISTNLQGTTSPLYTASVYIGVLSPLRCATDTMSSISYTVFSRFLPTTKFYGQRTLVDPLQVVKDTRTMEFHNITGVDALAYCHYDELGNNTGKIVTFGGGATITNDYGTGIRIAVSNDSSLFPAKLDQSQVEPDVDCVLNLIGAQADRPKLNFKVTDGPVSQTFLVNYGEYLRIGTYESSTYTIDVSPPPANIAEAEGSVQSAIIDDAYSGISNTTRVQRVSDGVQLDVDRDLTDLKQSQLDRADDNYGTITSYLKYASWLVPGSQAVDLAGVVFDDTMRKDGFKPGALAYDLGKMAAWESVKSAAKEQFPDFKHPIPDTLERAKWTVLDYQNGISFTDAISNNFGIPEMSDTPQMLGQTESSIPPQHRTEWRDSHPGSSNNQISTRPWLDHSSLRTGVFADVNNDNPTVPLDPLPAMLYTNPSLSMGMGPQFYRQLKLDHVAKDTHPISDVPVETENQFSFSYLKNVKSLIGSFTISKDTNVNDELFRLPITPHLGYKMGTVDVNGVSHDKIQPSTLSVLASNFAYRSGDIEFEFMAVKTPIHSFRLAIVTSPDTIPSTKTYEDYPKAVYDFEENNAITTMAPYYAPTKVAPMWESSIKVNEDSSGVYFGYISVFLASEFVYMDSISDTVEVLVFVKGADNFQLHTPIPPKLKYINTLVPKKQNRKRNFAIPEADERLQVDSMFFPTIPARPLTSILHSTEQVDLPSLCRRTNLISSQLVTFDKHIMATEFDVKFTPYDTVTTGETYPIMNQMSDAFVFSRGSKRYLLLIRPTDAPVFARVIHFPYVNDYRDAPLTFAAEDNYNIDDFGQNLASEIANTQQQCALPFEVPYVQPLNMLLNSADPTTDGVYGVSTQSNGVIRMILESKQGSSAFIQLYELMGDDSRMYIFQGFQPMYYEKSQILYGNTSLPTLTSGSGNVAIPEMEEQKDFKPVEQEKQFDALAVLKDLRKYYIKNNDLNKAKEVKFEIRRLVLNQRKNKSLKSLNRALINYKKNVVFAEPEGDGVGLMDVLNIPKTTASILNKTSTMLGDCKDKVPEMFSNLTQAAKDLSGCSNNASSMFSSITSCLSGFMNGFKEVVNNISRGSIAINVISSLVHIWNIFKSDSVFSKLLNFVGLLSSLGIDILKIAEDFIPMVSNLFKTNEYIAEMEMDEKGMDKSLEYCKLFVPIIISFIGFKSVKPSETFYKKIATMFKDFFWTANFFDRFVTINLDCIKTIIYYCLGKDNPDAVAITELKKVSTKVDKWAKRVLELSDITYKEQIETNAALQKEILRLWNEGNEYLTMQIENAEMRKISAIISSVHKKCTTLYDLLGSKIASGFSIEPLSLWFHGDAGVGKSRLAEDLCVKLGQAMRIVCNGEVSYIRNNADKFWSGYSNQPFVIFDDWGQIKEPQVMTALLQDWWGLCTCHAYNANMAELADKGRNIQPVCLLSFSNVAYPTSAIVESREALLRRRDKLITVELAEWFKAKHNGISAINSDFMLNNPETAERIKKFEHLIFTFKHPIKPNETVSEGNKQYNYNELCDILCEFSAKTYNSRKEEAKRRLANYNPLSADAWEKFLVNKSMEVDKDKIDVKELIDNSAIASEKLDERLDVAGRKEQDFTISKLHEDAKKKIGEAEGEEYEDAQSDLNCESDPEKIKEIFDLHNRVKNLLKAPSVGCWCNETEILWTCAPADSRHAKMVDGKYQCIHRQFDFSKINVVCTTHQMSELVPTGEGNVQIPWVPCMARDCVFKDKLSSKKFYNSYLDNLDPHKAWYKSMKENTFFVAEDSRLKAEYEHVKKALSKLSSFVMDLFRFATPFILTIVFIINMIRIVIGIYCIFTKPWGRVKKANDSLELAECLSLNNLAIIPKQFTSMVELGVSGDVKTSKSNLSRGRIAMPQGEINSLVKLVKRNTMFLTAKCNGKIRNIRGIGLVDRYVLFPNHFFVNLETDKVFGKMYNGGVVEFNKDSLIIESLKDFDLCLVKLPPRMPCFKSLLHLLPTTEDFNILSTSCIIPEIPSDDSDVIIHSLKNIEFIKTTYSYLIENNKEIDHELVGARYDIHGKGFCGNLLVDFTHNKIFGMHVMALDGLGHANLICQDWFKNLIAKVKDVEEPEKEFEGTKLPLDGDFIPVSSLAEEEQVCQPVRSSIIESEAFSVLAEPKRMPVVFCQKGEAKPGYIALAKGLNKHVPTHPFDTKDIETTAKFMTEEVLNICKPVCKPKSVRSIKEVVKGLPGIPFMDGIRLNTSPGFPLNHEFRGKKKKDFIQVEEDEVLLHKRLLEIYKHEHDLRQVGTQPYCPYFNFLKDERLRPGKDARLINGCSVTETIEWRRYCSDFFAAFQHQGFKVGSAIGTNVRSPAWSDLAKRLLEKGDCILSADYKSFGNTNDPQIIDKLREICLAWYQKYTNTTKEEQQVRYILFESLCFVTHVAGDCVIKTLQGFPSGNPYTAPLNTMINKFYMYLSWLNIFKDSSLQDLTNFKKYVYFCFYGDDMVGSIHPSLSKIYNNKTIANFMNSHGIQMQDARKRGEIVEFDKLEDVSFLKCDFVKHPHMRGVYLAGLDKSVIEDIPSWVRKPCPDLRQQTLINCEQAMMFAHGWGPEYFERVLSKLQSYWSAKGVNFQFRSWEEQDKLVLNADKYEYNIMDDPLERYLHEIC